MTYQQMIRERLIISAWRCGGTVVLMVVWGVLREGVRLYS